MDLASEKKQEDSIEGELIHIRFKSNDDPAFVIGTVKTNMPERKEATVLGTIRNPSVGASYKLFGKWVENPRFGKQYKFSAYKAVLPKTTDGIFRYIVKTAKWIGPKIASRVIEKFGDQTLEVIKLHPEKIAAIKGLTLDRAKEIQQYILENEEFEKTLIDLEQLIGGAGLRKTLPLDLVKKYGTQAVAILHKNPYVLTDEKYTGFQPVDFIAINRFNVDKASIYRQKSACLHVIKEHIQQTGDTWMNVDMLLESVKMLIGIHAHEGFHSLVESGRLVIDKDFVTTQKHAKDETTICETIRKLLQWK